MTEETFAEIMTVLEVASRQKFSPEEQKVWWLLIGDLADEPARAATIRFCRHSSYPPKPADIVNAVLGDPRDANKLLEEEAALALAHFEEHFTDCIWQDYGPFINAVLRDMGGPDVVGMRMVKDEWKYDRQRFTELYKAYRRRGAFQDGPPIPHNVAAALTAHPGQTIEPKPVLFSPRGIPGLPAPGTVNDSDLADAPAAPTKMLPT